MECHWQILADFILTFLNSAHMSMKFAILISIKHINSIPKIADNLICYFWNSKLSIIGILKIMSIFVDISKCKTVTGVKLM